MVETLERGREAIGRHAWDEAVEAFSAADHDSGLDPEDLERLGAAAWWAGRPEMASEPLERAFFAYQAGGRPLDAARVGMNLAYQAFRRRALSIGNGWLARVERLLASEPESGAHARHLVFQLFGALVAGRIEDAIDLADRAMELARRHDEHDVLFAAMSFKGFALVLSGDWQAGLALVDEAATAAASGGLALRVSSDIYCNTIAACRTAGDFRRAGQWVEEAERWMRGRSVGGYPGICKVHRAELKMLRGHWPEAEQEARQACEELERFGLLDGVGFAHYQIGEIRLRIGDLGGAAAAFERAYEFGHPAQPGMSLLLLARGETKEAARSIGRALASTSGAEGRVDRATRAQLLPAQIDIALAAGDLETAGRAVAELESIALDFDQPVFEAGALTGRGELLLGEARPSEASPILGRSWRLWQETELPYESARARLRYAEALAADGDAAAARMDLRAVRAAFERLGARRDLQRVDALLDGDAPASERTSRRTTRTFMFTDIVTSTNLVGLIGDDAWAELLHWHDRALRAAFTEHHGEEVKSTGDGFFVAFERPMDGVTCAVGIQRRLSQHRHEHGFAPLVRIGLHAAEAAQQDNDYIGRGVHVAARVGAAAAAEEILVSTATLGEVADLPYVLSEPRELMLKGVDEPLEVRTVEWRSDS
jgi:class 3 adenylate cyclase